MKINQILPSSSKFAPSAASKPSIICFGFNFKFLTIVDNNRRFSSFSSPPASFPKYKSLQSWYWYCPLMQLFNHVCKSSHFDPAIHAAKLGFPVLQRVSICFPRFFSASKDFFRKYCNSGFKQSAARGEATSATLYHWGEFRLSLIINL